jgi:hypothetical protein
MLLNKDEMVETQNFASLRIFRFNQGQGKSGKKNSQAKTCLIAQKNVYIAQKALDTPRVK